VWGTLALDRISGVNREDKLCRWDQDRAGHVGGVVAVAAIGNDDYGAMGAVILFDFFIVIALGDDSSGLECDMLPSCFEHLCEKWQ
jgi:hypothetical protein